MGREIKTPGGKVCEMSDWDHKTGFYKPPHYSPEHTEERQRKQIKKLLRRKKQEDAER